MIINQDLESQRMRRNQTLTQQKVTNSLREGAILNANLPLSESYNSLMIADSVELPNKLYEKDNKKEKSILPIAGITVGIMGGLAAVTGLFAKSAKDAVDVDLAKKLPHMTRNVCVNKEMDQAIYRLVANPTKKTAMAACSVLWRLWVKLSAKVSKMFGLRKKRLISKKICKKTLYRLKPNLSQAKCKL